jgi:hypothetical protein
MTAARAALVRESVERGAPRLPLTVAAVTEELAERRPRLRATIQDAHDAYRAGREGDDRLHPATVQAFASLVRSLDEYGGA